VVNGTGIGGNFPSVSHIKNQLRQGDRFRRNDQKPIALEKIIQAFPAKLSRCGLSVAAAGKEDFIDGLPLWIDRNIPRDSVEYF